MNLTVDPWIPALRADSRRDLFSLQDLFAQAHALRDLAVKPHERIALMRLLLCITQAALDGPADEADWEICQPRIQPRARDYLTRWKAAFELFGDGPRFLQFSNLMRSKESDDGNAATKLDLALATGNNSILFDNFGAAERTLPAARMATGLVAFQCFSPGGRIGVARWSGRETPGKGSSSHAPCTPSSMVHTLILGDSLLASIHCNLLTRENITDAYGANRWGKPVWECAWENDGDPAALDNATLTYMGRLLPMSRAIRLHEGGGSFILANGLDYPAFPAFREATATIIRRKDELAVLPGSTARSLWRQLSAIAIQRRAGNDAACGPLALNHARTTADTVLWVGALVTDKAKIEDVVESAYSLPPGMFTELGRTAYERGVGLAEDREGLLVQSVKAYATPLKSGAPPYGRARQRFWTRVEQHLSALFDLARNPGLIADLPNTVWGKSVAAAALAAYELSCPRQTPRQIQAYALGLRKLTHLRKPPSEPRSTAHE